MSTPTSSADPDCLFCKIVAGDIPATIVARTERVVAFRDINPQAPTHVLLIPVEHRPTAADTAESDPAVVGEMVAMAGTIARDEGIAESVGGHGYRLVFNTGPASGQEVFHTHLHLLGGRKFTWPPG